MRPPARTAYPLATRIATAWCGGLWWAATPGSAPSQGVPPVRVLVAGAIAEHDCARMVPVAAPSSVGAPPQIVDLVVADTVDDVLSALAAARAGKDPQRAVGEARKVLERMRHTAEKR